MRPQKEHEACGTDRDGLWRQKPCQKLQEAEAVLGNLLDIASGLLTDKRNRSARRQSQRQFDAQMDESVQRRVKDAEKAGIHPLFALGASVGTSPTTITGPTGSGVGDALSRVSDRISGKRVAAAGIRQAEASAARDEAEAMLLNSERKKLEQEFTARGHDGASVVGPVGLEKPTVQFGPDTYESVPARRQKVTGVATGSNPAWIEQVNPDGSRHWVVNPDLGMDEVGQVINAAKQLWYQGRKLLKPHYVSNEAWVKAWNSQRKKKGKPIPYKMGVNQGTFRRK